MKLHWFSPLPPAASEIAGHTARLLPALRKLADVVLWTSQSNWDSRLERLAPIRTYLPESMPWDEIGREGVAVFNIGNDVLNLGDIWQVGRHQPGIVVLHDTHLQHLFVGLHQQGKLDEYFRLMKTHHGREGAAAAEDMLAGRVPIDNLAKQFPLTELAIESAAGVIVHTPEALFEASAWPTFVALANLPYDPKALCATPPSGPPYRLIAFGHIGSNRRLESVIHALGQYPRRKKVCLDVYGRVHDEAHFRELARTAGLRDCVTFHGFVDEAVLETALASAHLAVNLRYPTMGEASASQLRIWEHALPSLTTPVGWYASLPEGTTLHVRPTNELEDIHQALDGLIADPNRYRRIGEAGRRHLEAHHRTADYAETVVSMANLVNGRSGHALARRLTVRVAERMAPWSHSIKELSCRRLAQHMQRLSCHVPSR